MKYDYSIRTNRKVGMMTMRLGLLSAFLISHFSFLICPASAQGMVTEIKVIAIHNKGDLEGHAKGYSGGGDLDLDFRKGRGGGYVFALFKNARDTAKYITDVLVTADRGNAFGQPYESGGKQYTPAVFYQETGEHYDKDYKGGLNGRDYGAYGGAYREQPHVYVSRTGNRDFKNRVLEKAVVCTTEPVTVKDNQSKSGGHGGGGRYFLFTWHKHQSFYERKITDETPKGNTQVHIRHCDPVKCGLSIEEDHTFEQSYGSDKWGQYPPEHPDRAKYHYKQCKYCGQEVVDDHQFASYVSDSDAHNKRCLACGYVDDAGHAGFALQKLPVDEYYHAIYCDSCGYLKKLPHDYGNYKRSVELEECDHSIVRYSCSQCGHQVHAEEAGIGHQLNSYGICTREGCLHPYERPGVEPFGNGDSIYVVKTFGHLYWIADYVNNRRPKTNIRLDNDLIADDFVSLPWTPIGAADSTAFQGTFDGGGHVITMLKTEEPEAGSNNRGLFGVIAKEGTVKNVSLAGCQIRGWDYIGTVAGVNEGTISGCHVVFSILNSIGTGKNIGGICGMNKGTISGCTTDNSVWVGSVRDYAGSICGTNEGGSLSGNVAAAICGNGSNALLPEVASQP